MAHERLTHGAEHDHSEVSHEAAKRSAELHKERIETHPHSQKEREKAAHKEALEAASEIKEVKTAEVINDSQETEAPATKRQREQSFKNTMAHVRSQMPRSQKTFSQIIHNPTVEKVSDFVGSTIARPDSIVTGSFFALVAVLGLYLTAKFIGFSLSGFETIGAFILGWIAGIIFDLVRGVFKR